MLHIIFKSYIFKFLKIYEYSTALIDVFQKQNYIIKDNQKFKFRMAFNPITLEYDKSVQGEILRKIDNNHKVIII